MIQQWMVSISSQELRQILPNVSVSEQQLQKYIIQRGAMETSPQSQSSDASYMSAESEPTVNGHHQGAAVEVPACNQEPEVGL